MSPKGILPAIISCNFPSPIKLEVVSIDVKKHYGRPQREELESHVDLDVLECYGVLHGNVSSLRICIGKRILDGKSGVMLFLRQNQPSMSDMEIYHQVRHY